MHESGLINDDEYARAIKAPLGVTKTPSQHRQPLPVLRRPHPPPARARLPRRCAAGRRPHRAQRDVARRRRRTAEGAVTRTLKSLDSKRRPPLQAGLVVTDVHNGDVVAVVGSRSFQDHGFNRAVEAQRPVGSLLKPFVYLLALAQPQRWSLASFGRRLAGRRWPRAAASAGRRATPMAAATARCAWIDALAHSYNQATVRVGMQVDPRRLASWSRCSRASRPIRTLA
jgi:penicillin-binding protein 1B